MMRTGDLGDDGTGVELAQTVAADVKNIDAVMVSRVISPPEEFCKGVLVNRAAKSILNEPVCHQQRQWAKRQEGRL